MARSSPRIDFHSSHLDRLRWILEFSELDLEALSASSASRWFTEAQDLVLRRPDSLGFELGPFRTKKELDDVTDILANKPDKAIKALQAIQPYLVDALTTVKRDGSWQLPFVPSRAVLFPAGEPWAPTLRVLYTGAFVTMFVYSAVEAMVAAWPATRVCCSETCGRVFLFEHQRQCFCSPSCSNRERKRRFLAATPRDHHEEYRRQVVRNVGKSVKVQRRKRPPR